MYIKVIVGSLILGLCSVGLANTVYIKNISTGMNAKAETIYFDIVADGSKIESGKVTLKANSQMMIVVPSMNKYHHIALIPTQVNGKEIPSSSTRITEKRTCAAIFTENTIAAPENTVYIGHNRSGANSKTYYCGKL